MLRTKQNKDEWTKKSKSEIKENGFEKWWRCQKEMVVKSSGIKYSPRSHFATQNTMKLEELYVLAANDDSNDIPYDVSEVKVQYKSIPDKLSDSNKENHLIKKIKHYVEMPFDNWGDNIHNSPLVTFVPKSKNEVIQIVKWANKHGKRVRCSGYRHTWNNMYSDDNEVLICMIPLEQSAMQQENLFDHYPQNAHDDNTNDLLNIELLKSPINSDINQGLVKIGASVNNEAFRKWCIRNNIAIPMNVIMVEITLGGSNAPICHGSGINNKTLSDIVYAIEVVDYKGRLRNFNRIQHPKEMTVLSGSFGLCGVIVSLTLEVNNISYAVLEPYKPLLHEGIPRPEGIVDEMGNPSKQFDLFRKLVLDYYYNEFFWFPPSDRLWINCWKNNGSEKDAEEYPSHIETHIHEVSSMLGEFANNTLFKLFPDKLQQNIFSHMAMAGLPGPEVKSINDVNNDEKVTTQIMNGLHFRRGIHNMKVRDYELEIPIPNDPYRGNDKPVPDLQFVSELWWIGIDLINEYKSKEKYPIQVALEMRIMSGSSRVLMAPQKGNKWTCAIEVLTTTNIPQKEWVGFVNELNKRWFNSSMIEKLKMQGLFCRPHWAKEWDTLILDDMPSIDYVKKIYYDEINEFNYVKKDLNLDPLGMFSNKLFDEMFDIHFFPEHYDPIRLNKKKCCSCCVL